MNNEEEINANRANIDRRKLLPHLFPNHEEYLFVSGLAGASRDAAALTGDGAHLFALGGVMGAATTLGLGVAMGAPDKKVAVITGDGELMMNIGSLVTVATAAPKKLSIVCIDNGLHGETGKQPGHTAQGADIESIAKGAGFRSAMTIRDEAELTATRDFLETSIGPRILVAKVLPTGPTKFKRLMDPPAVRLRFRDAFLANQRKS